MTARHVPLRATLRLNEHLDSDNVLSQAVASTAALSGNAAIPHIGARLPKPAALWSDRAHRTKTAAPTRMVSDTPMFHRARQRAGAYSLS